MTLLALVSLALRITVIVGAAAIINTLRRRASASSRHWLWILALAGALILPFAQYAAPAVRILPWAPAESAVPSSGSLGQMTSATTQSPVLARAAFVDPETSAPKPSSPITIELTFLLIWAFGTVLLLFRLCRAHVVAHGLVRRSREYQGVRTVSVAVRTSDEIELPFTYGLRSAVIILPADIELWSSGRMKATLLHEEAHAIRGDGIWLLLSQIIRALYWWHPAILYATRAAASERERACDDAVIRHGIKPSEYGHCLLTHAQSITAWTASPVATVMFGHSAGLGQRVVALLDPAIDRSSSARPKLTAIASMLSLVGLVGAAAPQQRVTQLVSAVMMPVTIIAPTEQSNKVVRVAAVPDADVCKQARNTRNARTYADKSVRITGAGATFRDGITRQIWTGADCIAWIQYSGAVYATDDERNIIVGDGGKFTAHNEGPEGIRELSMSQQSMSMTLNGNATPVGASEQAWIAGMTKEFLRRTGLRAKNRALSALTGGVKNLLAEVAAIPRVDLRVEYLREGFAGINDANGVAAYIHEAAALLDSSDARAEFLLSTPHKYENNLQVLAAIYEEASVIEPDDAVESVFRGVSAPRPVPAPLAPFVERMIIGLQSVERRTAWRAYYMSVVP